MEIVIIAANIPPLEKVIKPKPKNKTNSDKSIAFPPQSLPRRIWLRTKIANDQNTA